MEGLRGKAEEMGEERSEKVGREKGGE